MKIEDIFNGPDYFRCERFGARMRKKNCVARQDKRPHFGIWDSDALQSFPECRDCEQGEEIAASVSPISSISLISSHATDQLKEGEMEGIKVCTKCKKEKSLEDYYKNHSTPDGLEYWCKDCKRESATRYRQSKDLPARRAYLRPADRQAGGRRQEALAVEAVKTADVATVEHEDNSGIYRAAAAAFVRGMERKFVEEIANSLRQSSKSADVEPQTHTDAHRR